MSPQESLSEGDFQRLFATEAEGRLDTLVDELLELEKGGANPEVVASLFREAHTIKGGAAVVGMPHVARVAHALEDLLEEVRRERRGVDTALIDAVLAGVDAIRTLIPLAVAGQEHEQVAFEAEQRLRIAVGGPPVGEAPASAGDTPARPTPPAAPAAPAPAPASPAAPVAEAAPARASAGATPPSPAPAPAAPPAPPPASTPPPASPSPEPAPAGGPERPVGASEGVAPPPVPAGPPSAAEHGTSVEPAATHGVEERATAEARPTADSAAGHGEPARATATEMLQIPVHRIDDLVRLIGEASAATLRLGSALLERLERDPSSLTEYRDLVRSLNELQELALHRPDDPGHVSRAAAPPGGARPGPGDRQGGAFRDPGRGRRDRPRGPGASRRSSPPPGPQRGRPRHRVPRMSAACTASRRRGRSGFTPCSSAPRWSSQ